MISAHLRFMHWATFILTLFMLKEVNPKVLGLYEPLLRAVRRACNSKRSRLGKCNESPNSSEYTALFLASSGVIAYGVFALTTEKHWGISRQRDSVGT